MLPPEEDLAEVAEVPAVADDPVVGGRQAGEERRLHRARHRRQHGAELGLEPVAGERREPRHVVEELGRQPDDVEDEELSAHASASVSPSSSSCARVHSTSRASASTSAAVVAGPAVLGQDGPGVRLDLEVAGERRLAADERVQRRRQLRLRGLAAVGVHGDVEVDPPLARRPGARPPCASSRSSTPATTPPRRSRVWWRKRGSANAASLAAEARERGDETRSALDTCAFTIGTPAAAERGDRSVGLLELDGEVAGVEADPDPLGLEVEEERAGLLRRLDDAARLGLEPDPDAPAGLALELGERAGEPGELRARTRPAPRRPTARASRAGASRSSPPRRRPAAAPRGAGPGRGCTRGAPGRSSPAGRRAA